MKHRAGSKKERTEIREKRMSLRKVSTKETCEAMKERPPRAIQFTLFFISRRSPSQEKSKARHRVREIFPAETQ